jgi:glycosyltransferase involved in cell wall biosynthesis
MAIPGFLPARGYGGPIEVVLCLADGLVSAGVELEVLTSTLIEPGRSGLPPGPARERDLDVLRMPTPIAFRWSPWVRFRAPERRPDVLHVFGVWNGLSYAAMRWAESAGVPWIWEPSGMLPTRGRHRWVKRLVTPWHVRRARAAAGVIWTSPQERKEAPAGLTDVRYWLRSNPPPADLPTDLPDRAEARRRLDLPAEGPLWGYLGRIDDRKGIPEVLEAWREARGPGTLLFAGPAAHAELAAMIDGTAGARRLEPLDADTRWLYLRALDSLVLAPKFGENFGIVVMEAIAVGTPALVTPEVGAGYWLAEAGATATTGGHAEWVRRFRDGDLPPPAGRIPESLTNAPICEQMVRIYREAIGPRGD